MTFTSDFLIKNPVEVVDLLVKQHFDNNISGDCAEFVIDTFKEHFNNDLIIEEIPLAHPLTPKDSRLIKFTGLIHQNNFEPEYFPSGHRDGVNFGYFKTTTFDQIDDDHNVGFKDTKFKERKQIHVRQVFSGELSNIALRLFYYDSHLDNVPLNSLHTFIGFFEDSAESSESHEDSIFHVLFSIPSTDQRPSIDDLKTVPEFPEKLELLKYFCASRVNRVHGEAIGAFALNLYNVDCDSKFEEINALIRQCFPSVKVIKVNGKDLDNKDLCPKFDAETGLLAIGELQCAPGTCFLLDERELECGQLSERATKNMKALINLVQRGIVLYTFPLIDDIEVPVDCPCLIVSKEKSLLPANWRVNVKDISIADVIIPDDCKEFFQVVRHAKCDFSDELALTIEKSVTEKKVPLNRLHDILTLTKLIAASKLSDQVTLSDWQRALLLFNQS